MGRQFSFGTGDIYATNAAGNSVKIGTLQGVKVGFSFDEKTLHGQKGFAVAVARGKGKIEGSWESGELDVAAYNSLFFGEQAITTGGRRAVRNELGTIPATPFTVTAANGATYFQDLGVSNAITADAFVRVDAAATPAAGQYKVSAAGVYTFAVADIGKKVLLNYIWNDAAGRRLDITNQDMGAQPEFQLILASKFQGKEALCHFYRCTSSKLDMPFKQDDFMMPEAAFSAFANDADQVGYLSYTG